MFSFPALRNIAPLLLVAIFAILSIPARGDEFSEIKLVHTKNYDPAKDSDADAEAAKSSFQLFFLNLKKDKEELIKKKVMEILNGEDISNQDIFTSKEKDKLASRIAKKVNDEYLTGTQSNPKMIRATFYIAKEIYNEVIIRSLTKRGVDPTRAGLWSKKIIANLAPCANKTKAPSQVENCANNIKDDLKLNLGLALTYEMSKKYLSEDKFVLPRPTEYINCIRPKTKGADDRVERCVIQSVGNGIVDYAKDLVESQLINSDPQKAVMTTENAKKFASCC